MKTIKISSEPNDDTTTMCVFCEGFKADQRFIGSPFAGYHTKCLKQSRPTAKALVKATPGQYSVIDDEHLDGANNVRSGSGP